MDVEWSKCLTECIERVLDQEQYSKKNNALLHGFKNLPNLRGLDFILFIVDQLNLMIPSLRGRVLPIHIDDAQTLKTKRNRSNNKVVIINFANRWVKHELLWCQLDLKATPFAVTEQQ